jgi:nucleotide-binding universal stress UspA family protein
MSVSNTTPIVIVGVDGSSNADAAVQWAHQYAESTGASLRLVVAWEWPMSYGYPVTLDGFDPEADAAKVAEKVAAGLSLPPDRVTTYVQEGPAGEVLVDASREADLLVVGRRGHRAIASRLLGSVSAYCVHHGTTAIVIVRMPDEAATAD